MGKGTKHGQPDHDGVFSGGLSLGGQDGGANPRPEWQFLWSSASYPMSPEWSRNSIISCYATTYLGTFSQGHLFKRGERPPIRARPLAVLALSSRYGFSTLTYQGRLARLGRAKECVGAGEAGSPKPSSPVQSRQNCRGPWFQLQRSCAILSRWQGLGGGVNRLDVVWLPLTADQLIDKVSNGNPAAELCRPWIADRAGRKGRRSLELSGAR